MGSRGNAVIREFSGFSDASQLPGFLDLAQMAEISGNVDKGKVMQPGDHLLKQSLSHTVAIITEGSFYPFK